MSQFIAACAGITATALRGHGTACRGIVGASGWRSSSPLVGALLTGPVSPVQATEEADAAPAVAERLLADAGINARYGHGHEGGNHIGDVADRMRQDAGTDFDGVFKEEVEAYEVCGGHLPARRIVHSEQPGYRDVVRFSRRLSEVVGCYVHVITDDVPGVEDAMPV